MPRSNSNNSDNGYTCCHCNEPLSTKSYYKNNSDFYFGTHHLPICKNCLNKMFNLYALQYQSTKKAMQRLCMAYDFYYNEALFESCDDGSDVVVGNYIKKLNMNQHKNKTFDTSINEGFSFGALSSSTSESSDSTLDGKGEESNEPPIDPKLEMKWGKGFSSSDYVALEKHYNQLKRNNPNTTNNQEIFITSLCHLNMLMMKALRESDLDAYAKANEQYGKTFAKAGLKTVQEVDMGSDDCWGEWVRRVEEYTPAEYYKNKELFKDYDNIGDYFKRFVLRPLRNLMHGTTDRDYEYCVKDGDENEFSEPN